LKKRLSTSSRNSANVILLFGPTAAGKTDLIADLFTTRFEIINADSEQVYRGLSIGTAKPDAALLARVPHHLIDILDPAQLFTVGVFVRAADRLAEEIRRRGNTPVVSGGAAFYIRHFLFGLPASPPSDPAVRAAVRRDLAAQGSAALYAELAARDPAAARKIHQADTYRVSRAVEIIRQTGKPLSSFALSRQPRPGYRFLSIGLTLSREELRERITRRVDAMFAAGLEHEIHMLREKGYDEAMPGLRGIGYREFFAPGENGTSAALVREAIKLHSLQYAKRQMTFFKRLPHVHWFRPDEKKAIRSLVDAFLSRQDGLNPPPTHSSGQVGP
jgi:tRNA dimethylallyltransferase